MTNKISLPLVLFVTLSPGGEVGAAQERSITSMLLDETLEIPVSTEPDLLIGTETGVPEYELYRVTDVRELPDGRLVVANSGSSELRFFSSTGHHLFSHGSGGSGPGEYRVIDGIHVFAEDSIAVFDQFNQRISILRTDGRLLNTIALADAQGNRLGRGQYVIGYSAHGPVVSYGGRSFSSGDTTQVTRDTLRLAIFDTTERLLGPARLSYLDSENFVYSNGGSVSVGPLPFGRSTFLATNGDSIVVADNTSFSLTISNWKTGQTSTASLLGNQQSLDRAIIADFKDEAMASIPERWRTVRRRALEETPFPSHVAPYDQLLLDDRGAVWLRLSPAGSDHARWIVVESEGLTRWLRLPAEFEPTQAGDSWILGVLTDELGVEVVVRYRIREI